MKAPDSKMLNKYLESPAFCPWCFSNNISEDDFAQVEGKIAWHHFTCQSCDAEWQNEYSLETISWLNEHGDREYNDEIDVDDI